MVKVQQLMESLGKWNYIVPERKSRFFKKFRIKAGDLFFKKFSGLVKNQLFS
jgi:hypothetical protein